MRWRPSTLLSATGGQDNGRLNLGRNLNAVSRRAECDELLFQCFCSLLGQTKVHIAWSAIICDPVTTKRLVPIFAVAASAQICTDPWIGMTFDLADRKQYDRWTIQCRITCEGASARCQNLLWPIGPLFLSLWQCPDWMQGCRPRSTRPENRAR